MNTGNREYHISIYLLFIIIVLYILGHFLAGYIIDNHWSFVQWQYLPTWYVIAWIAVLCALIVLAGKTDTIVEKFSPSKRLLIISSAILFIMMLISQYDSFVNGGGNLKIAQLTQTEKIIPRWFEYGTIVTVSIFFKAFKLFGIADNSAGVYAWKLLAFIGTLFYMAGAVKLVRELSCERIKKVFLFVILFFGPQTIIYFGLVGVEPVVVAFTIWFAFVAVKLNKFFTTNRLLLLWFITILGIIFHYSLAFLIPALLYLSLRTRPNKKQTAPIITALASYLILLFMVYYKGNASLEFSRFLLFIHGENPHSDYGLFSPKHLSDIIQIILLSFPPLIVFIYLIFKSPLKIKHNPLSVVALLLSLSGFTMMFILSPINSIVFDFPRMTAYLSPLSFLAILILAPPVKETSAQRKFLIIMSVVSILLPLSYLPVHTRLANMADYATDYFEKDNTYYREGCLAIRDAYYYQSDFTTAERWAKKLPLKSPDYLFFDGAKRMAEGGENTAAINELYRFVPKHTYWTEPKALLANLLLKSRRFEAAKKIIDECRQLEPYNKTHLDNLYQYYRDVKNYPEALKVIDKIFEISPGNLETLTDKMIIYYRSGAFQMADSLGDYIINADPAKSYPYLIRGFIHEAQDNLTGAVKFYGIFLKLDSTEAKLYNIQERYDSLKAQLENR